MKPIVIGFSIMLLGLFAARATERQLIQDNDFQRGFILWEPKPGKHIRYGELAGFESDTKPVWGLSQWSSKFPLAALRLTNTSDRILVYSNAAKAVVLGAKGTSREDISMAVNASVEYGTNARKAGDPWVHLLVEQEFEPPATLEKLSAATLHVEAKLLRSHLVHTNGNTPDLHAAQFQIFFTVQNRNRASAGYGDLVWFGIPIYDSRHRFIPEFKEQDFGGTAKFIFTPEGKTFSSSSAYEREWLVIEKDLLPLMKEAVKTARARGFLKDSQDLADYYIGGMNMGWEVTGIFDVEMQVRNLSFKLDFSADQRD